MLVLRFGATAAALWQQKREHGDLDYPPAACTVTL